MDAVAREQQRLAALRSYEVLGSPREAVLDRVAELAAKLFDTPMAVVGLIDECRQWYKARFGVEDDGVARELSFCRHALGLPAHAVMVVEDASIDPRFRDHPFVTGGPQVRFYAGALLTDADGHHLGTLCVFGPTARAIRSNGEIEHLQTLAALIVDHLQSRRARIRLEREQQRLAERDAQLEQLNSELEHRVAERTEELEHERAKLEAGRARLREVVAHAHEAIIVMDEQGVIDSWNRQAEVTFGWPESHAIGRTVSELIIPEAFREKHRAGLERFIATGQGSVVGQRIELPALHRDGREILVELAISANHGPEGWRFTGLMHDITERKAQAEVVENAFQHSAIGMALVGLDGQFLRTNEAFGRIVGYEAEELTEVTFQQITHPDDLNRDIELLGDLTFGRVPSYQLDKRYIRKDGGAVWVSLTVSLARRRNGEPKHYIAQVQDLTARMEAEARYKLMAERATDMIVTSDLSGRTTFVSAGVKAITGWTPAEALGRQVSEYVHPGDQDIVRRAFGDIARGKPARRIRWRGWNRDLQDWMWLESSPALLTEGDEPCFVDVVRDITAQVAQEEALAAAREAAEAAVAAKSEFLANMSHEIRTPLTSVIGFSGLLKARDDLSPQARHFAERIAGGAEALLSVINSILDFSKVEAGEVDIRPAPTDVRSLADQILALFQPQASAKSLTLHLEADAAVPPRVQVDPQAFRQILLNLAGNAVKFTETGSVSVHLGYAGETLKVTVRDTGAGLTADQQEKLFQRFSQVDGSSTRRHGGTGLGLAICKGLVQAMGGRIGVESEPGQGSCFWFEARAPEAAEQDGAAANAIDRLLDGLRVLVVDDTRVNRDMARALLVQLGCEVTLSVDGAAAVEAARALPVDVILMDVRMPVMDGRAAARAIRSAAGPNVDVPILAFTAAHPDERFDDDFDGVIHKPVTAESLHQGIARALQMDGADEGPAKLRAP